MYPDFCNPNPVHIINTILFTGPEGRPRPALTVPMPPHPPRVLTLRLHARFRNPVCNSALEDSRRVVREDDVGVA